MRFHLVFLNLLAPILCVMTIPPDSGKVFGQTSLNPDRTDAPSGHISGQVINSDTGNPIEGVNVFLGHTTLGFESNKNGAFRLEQVPVGSFDLVLTHIGYEFIARRIRISDTDSLQFLFRMQPRIHDVDGTGIYGGMGVEVEADGPSIWRNRLKIFKQEFLGQSDFGKKSIILNPLVLDFEVDPESGVFSASTDSTLHIDNVALGYRLHLVLNEFRFSGRWNRPYSAEQSLGATLAFIDYTVYPRYEEMVAEDEDQAQRWHKNRQVAYGGSFPHFMRALAQNRLEEEGFGVKLSQVPINKIGVKLATFYRFDTRTIVTPDTLGLRRIQFTNYLLVRRGFQSSSLRLNSAYGLIDEEGALFEPRAFVKHGQWYEDRVGDMLPRDYRP
ncbi:MAG: carboxypeptidase-like regulatory domain-containing protein [Candidatus Latescibacteria bacterium]|nr:carboxypeptidase-like regulatory domain-containing protein [Candidatus Latescibacterota bacterium]